MHSNSDEVLWRVQMNSLWLYLSTNMKMDIYLYMVSISHIFVIFLHRLKFFEVWWWQILVKDPLAPRESPAGDHPVSHVLQTVQNIHLIKTYDRVHFILIVLGTQIIILHEYYIILHDYITWVLQCWLKTPSSCSSHLAHQGWVKSNISGKHQGWVGKIKHYQVGWGKSRLTSNITKLTGKHYQTWSMLQCFRKKSWVRVTVQNGSTKP